MTTTPQKTPLRRGDVVLVLFPDSNLRTFKPRPALVIQADNLGTELAQVIVAMITSNMKRGGHPSRITLARDTDLWKQAGLLTDSIIMTDNLATVMLSEIDRKIGSIPMQAVDNALRHTLGL